MPKGPDYDPGLVKSYEEIKSHIRSVPVSLTLGWS